MKLVKTLRPLSARAIGTGRSLCSPRAAKLCFVLLAAVFLLRFYYVRELLFAELALAVGFGIVALIGVGYILACIAVQKVGSELKALAARAVAKHRQPFAKARPLLPVTPGRRFRDYARTMQ